MSLTMKDLVADARTRVATVSPQEAQQAAAGGDLILDVREPGQQALLDLPRTLWESEVYEARADP